MSAIPKRAPYGAWKSPITADHVVNSPGRSADELLVDPGTSERYHLVVRPSESGRSALVHSETGKDVLPGKEWNVRTGVHEYGGAPAIVRDGIVYFSHRKDNRVYRFRAGEGEPTAVTPENPVYRYADFDVHPKYPHLLVSILEDHTRDAPSTVVNTLCIIDTESKTVSPLVSGADFYAQPRFAPDGAHLVWQQWSFPDMSWEGAEVYVADVSIVNGKTVTLANTKHVAGRPRKISAYYPSWVSADTILFQSDVSGYYNPWTYTLSTQEARPVLREPKAEDFDGVAPAWQLGWTFYVVLPGGSHAVFAAMRDGRSVLYLVDLHSGESINLENPYTLVDFMHWVPAERKIIFQGSLPNDDFKTVWLSITPASPLSKSEYKLKAIPDKRGKTSALTELPPGYISLPRGMTLDTPNGDKVHAIYWPPANPEYQGLDGETPPCVVNLHGGPTSAARPACSVGRLYFTSRGWAWLDVQYGGSSGYGRAYRERLNGMWGVTDREDTLNVSRAVAAQGLADSKRLVIRGGSSGGYVVLSAISFSSDPALFAAATSLYGISDLTALASDTHKFESRYVDGLLANIDENPQLFKERSPVQHADKIVTPLLLLQGDEDRVVPKSQSDTIYESIRRRGGVVEYQLYPGEGHGFRTAEHVKDATERELAFYRRILNISAAGLDDDRTPRAPPGVDAYYTFVVVHGLGFNANAFERVIRLAPTRGVRIVAVNRRNYAGSTPYTPEEASVFAKGSPEQRRALMLDEGARLAGFVAAFTRRLCPQGERSVHIVAWSLGNAYLLAMLAAVGQLDVDDRQALRRNLGTAMLYVDAPVGALGFEQFAGETPITDDVPPEQRGALFMRWVTSYYTHDLCTPARQMTQLRKTQEEADRDPRPTIESIPGEALGRMGSFAASQAADAYVCTEAFQGVLADLRRLGLHDSHNAYIWGGLRISYLWGERSNWNVVWGAWMVEASAQKAGAGGLPLQFKMLKGANHFAIWDAPAQVMDSFLNCAH
ncbi:hypothetical protein HDZ31DRAFT_30044 [Schizophyllum fasciatum]